MAEDLRQRIWRGIDRKRMTALLHRALAYPSPQTDLLEDDPQVAAFIRDVIVPEAQALGPETLRIDSKGSMVALWGPGTPAFGLILYAMTHPQTVMPDAFSPAIVDGGPFGISGPCMRGRGACEQKGAIAAVLTGLGAVLAGGTPLRSLALAAVTAGETGRPHAIRHLLDETGVTVDRALVACGTDNAICLAQKGRLDVDIVVRGKQSHSSLPWLGLNPLEGASAVLARLAAHKVLGEHPHLGRITLTPTALTTWPRATHTIPEVARITVDRRLRPGEDPEAALEGLKALVGDIAPFTLSYEAGAYMYPYELASEDRLPQLLQQGFEQVLGRPAEFVYRSGGLDAGYLNHRGIQALMFGPGNMAFAHTADEVVALDACADAAAVYAYAALAACEAGRAYGAMKEGRWM